MALQLRQPLLSRPARHYQQEHGLCQSAPHVFERLSAARARRVTFLDKTGTTC